MVDSNHSLWLSTSHLTTLRLHIILTKTSTRTDILSYDNGDNGDHTSAWFTTVTLNGKRLSFKLDTGAEVTAISMEAYKQLRKPQLTTPEKILYGPSRQPLKTTGEFAGKFSHNGEAATQRVFVVDGLKTNLLGLPAITALGLAIRTDAVDAASHDIRKQFSSLYSRDLGT